MTAAGNEAGRRHAAAPGAAGWLGLAAAPTFAVMALLTYTPGGDAGVMCSAGHGASVLGGMFPMYALMSAFHSAPWLRLIVRQRNIARSAAKQAAGRGGGLSYEEMEVSSLRRSAKAAARSR